MKLIEDLQLEFAPPSNYKDDYSGMTLKQLRWHIKGSGPNNPSAYPKGHRRHEETNSGLDPTFLPKKADTDPTTGKKMPGTTPINTPSAEEHNRIVQDYFQKVKMGLARPPRKLKSYSSTKTAARKSSESPHPKSGGIYDPKTKTWVAQKPIGTYGLTGRRETYTGVSTKRKKKPRKRTKEKEPVSAPPKAPKLTAKQRRRLQQVAARPQPPVAEPRRLTPQEIAKRKKIELRRKMMRGQIAPRSRARSESFNQIVGSHKYRSEEVNEHLSQILDKAME